jgi:hypothetical protein
LRKRKNPLGTDSPVSGTCFVLAAGWGAFLDLGEARTRGV